MSNKRILMRANVPGDLAQTVKVLSALKNIELSQIFTEALTAWIQLPENKELIDKHNLEP